LTIPELRDSKKLSAHATNVMYSLTGVVDNLEDPECLTELLIKLGRNHRRHSITQKEFHVSKSIGRKWSLKTSWNSLISWKMTFCCLKT
jgi:hypothetical protein